MARGGKREGAGRPAGAVTKRTREIADKAATDGITPLEFMLQVLRNDGADIKDRMWAAEKAAPYVHAKLSSIEHRGDLNVTTRTKEERDAIVEAALRADT
ncbi:MULTISPECIES: hypothetical protein [Chelativorans]|jgi:hypothetical protein|uniref:Uncharacterized protein n=1 Tax=Chelativorans sp. (strain BNC1) TaxID=266779 RepID=Q11LU8_CHESB|nr:MULTISPECIES: hypothetical protein [Chelativorans]